MSAISVSVTDKFKKQSKKAVNAIALFMFAYVTILLLAIALTIGCVFAGLGLIVSFPHFITLAVGVGLASLGVFVLIFLVKFLFKKNKIDYSHLKEIKAIDHPELFKMIDELVMDIGTMYPKKVYVSPDVNASVFYDSSFLSMFMPIEKNLQIGIGLVNCIHVDELKSILAHEFGHFSQKSMKVGSYVYHVNQIIHNMLFDNESYDKMVAKWAESSGYLALFLIVAVKIVAGIQWLLVKLYAIVNKAYLGLSREMEFHADEIAVKVSGYEPLKSSLLRMNLADYAFNSVVGFYEKKIDTNIKSSNVFKEQFYAMSFYSEIDNLELNHKLPMVTLYEQTKFNKSKLVIKNQWASHPSVEDRIKEMEVKGEKIVSADKRLAKCLFNDFELLEKDLTSFMFSSVIYKETPEVLGFDKFKTQFNEAFAENTFSKIFNGYYDNYNTQEFNLENEILITNTDVFNNLFSDEIVDKCYEAFAIEADIEALKIVSEKQSEIKTFDYDGNRYVKNEALKLVESIKNEQANLKDELKSNDIKIFNYFLQIEKDLDKQTQLKELYNDCFEFTDEYDEKLALINDLFNKLEFVSQTTEYKQIEVNFLECDKFEKKLKLHIDALLSNSIYEVELTEDIKSNFEKYTSTKLLYFSNEKYIDDNLQVLFKAINDYGLLLNYGYFKYKKQLLNYKESLMIMS
ncbi:M48 family metallopeptidase [uncultured Winogradskyella sp.]|uniref:M48 family metalloprotease n=1 Tax=uncultured Winogradskyella sp. TaxID=395353 RepID=UPI00261C2A28|nr:M48 family metallopeptidase [uncultured Winogradskyella sp.]|tara:strand:- start:314 stop:2371 length:2058 start_codon:yes stop_codon:yes gene_type:complete